MTTDPFAPGAEQPADRIPEKRPEKDPEVAELRAMLEQALAKIDALRAELEGFQLTSATLLISGQGPRGISIEDPMPQGLQGAAGPKPTAATAMCNEDGSIDLTFTAWE
jgi:hypothetical protein